MKKDSLGDRMKNNYENRSQLNLPRRTYTVIRLDGKAFHSYTRGLVRPYDTNLMEDMDETAKYLCENIQGCKFAYVQSDEITLVLTDFDTIQTDAWFDGNVQKIVSVSASMATAKFNQLRLQRSMIKDFESMVSSQKVSDLESDWHQAKAQPQVGKLAFFDSRVFVIPDMHEVVNMLIWRQQDATRNSIQMAAQSMFSHSELQGVNCSLLQEKMFSQRGVNWNDYPDGFKRGRCVLKKSYMAREGAKAHREDYLAPEVKRTFWSIENPPVFTQDRDYIITAITPQEDENGV